MQMCEHQSYSEIIPNTIRQSASPLPLSIFMSLNPIADVPDFSLAAPTVAAFAEALKDVCIESHAPAKDYKGNVETNITRMLAAPAGFTHRTAPTLVKGIEALKAGPMYERRAREEGVGVAGLGLTREKKKPPLSMTYGEVAAGAHGIDRIVAAGPSRTTLDSIVTPDMFASRFAVREGGEFVEDNSNAFLVHNLLTPIECEYIIATAEPHMKPLDKLYAQRTRLADRAMLRGPTVAQQLCRRLMPFITKEDYVGRTPLCFGHDGVWAPLGLNECLKVFRYERGGMFVPHRDGPWVPRPDQCSMYTVVIYLNDDFVGGQTVLSGSHDYCGPQGCRTNDWSRSSGMMHAVPIQGTALVLNHDCWHAAHPIDLGVKWILRTELIFQRVHSFYVDKDAFGTDETYRAARALYDASLAASEAGDRDTFFTSYQEVVKMQRTAMLSEAARRDDRLLSSLGFEELSNILSFLPVEAVVRCVMPLNRNTYAAVAQAPLWQELWEAEVARSGVPLPSAVGGTLEAAVLAPLAAGRVAVEGLGAPFGQPFLPTEFSVCPHSDYFGLYRLRRAFAPAAVLLLGGGAVVVSQVPRARRSGFARRCTDSRRARLVRISAMAPQSGAKKEKGFELLRADRYFGGLHSGAPYHMNMPSGEAMITSDNPDYLYEPALLVCPRTGAVEWSVLTSALETELEVADTPLIVVPHPAWAWSRAASTEEGGSTTNSNTTARSVFEANCRAAADALFGLAAAPGVGFYHPALCAALGYEASGLHRSGPHADRSMLTFALISGGQRFLKDDSVISEGGGGGGASPPPPNLYYIYTVDMTAWTIVAPADGSPSLAVDVSCADVVLTDSSEPFDTQLTTKKASSHQQHMLELTEVLAMGTRALAACPSLLGHLSFRVPSY